MKPFYPTFDYTPNWKGNRKRDPAEQFSVKIRDFPEMLRVKEAEGMGGLDLTAQDAEQNPTQALKIRSQQIEKLVELAKKQIVSFFGLVLEVEGQQKEIPSASAAEEAGLSDLLLEIGTRLLYGPGEEELKNS